MPEVIGCLWAESPKRVSRILQTLLSTVEMSLKQGFAPCKRVVRHYLVGGEGVCVYGCMNE